MWSERMLALLGVDVPIIQAPMAGAGGVELASAVATASGLGSLPCAMLDAATVVEQVGTFRAAGHQSINLNFFCHKTPVFDHQREQHWRDVLAAHYAQLGVTPPPIEAAAGRKPFDASMCEVVEQVRPKVVSFHFGLPEPQLLARVKATGATVLSSATTVAEARWLEQHGADAIIAQGAEAGGHRAMFLVSDMANDLAGQVGTFSLLPQVVDAVRLPVIASGGIADGRGLVAALALGAEAVQVGTAYLFATEAQISDMHRERLLTGEADDTALTNLFSGRPARGIYNHLMRSQGPMLDQIPEFPYAGAALAPLKKAAEAQGRADYSNLWAGQSLTLTRNYSRRSATQITLDLIAAAQDCVQTISPT